MNGNVMLETRHKAALLIMQTLVEGWSHHTGRIQHVQRNRTYDVIP